MGFKASLPSLTSIIRANSDSKWVETKLTGLKKQINVSLAVLPAH